MRCRQDMLPTGACWGSSPSSTAVPLHSLVQGLYACSAGCHPAGSVIGCAGHNAAAALIRDLGLVQWWQPAATR